MLSSPLLSSLSPHLISTSRFSSHLPHLLDIKPTLLLCEKNPLILLPVFFAAQMFVKLLNRLVLEIPIKFFEGKSCGFFSIASILTFSLFFNFLFHGYCDESQMVSVPLGFEISGFDRTKNWVSENGVFALGFLEKDDGDELGGFNVGIRYNLGVKSANLPVWTVGGGIRVSMNSTFRLAIDGRLVLVENPSGLVVWSSNTSNLGVQKATLLDNGNLVLFGNGEKVVWESFDSPTNTLLPGQSLYYPQTLRASSPKSISSYYNFVIEKSGEISLIWEHNVTYWRSQFPSSFSIVKEARFDFEGVLGIFDESNKRVWSISSKDFKDPFVSLRHLRIDQDGNLRIYSWDNVSYTWRFGWQAVEDQCKVFGYCGLYSVCGYNSTGPVCNCLYSDPLNPETGFFGSDLGSSGCKKMVDLGNCKMRTSMVVMKQTVLYGLYPPLDFDILLSEKACKEYCSNDTSCIAVTSMNDGSGLCSVKRTGYISGYKAPFGAATSFLKVCLVPQAVAAARGANPHGQMEPFSIPSSERKSAGKISIHAITVIIFSTVLGFLSLQIVVVWFVYRRRKIRAKMRVPFGKDAQMNSHYSALIRFSFDEIKEFTTDFKNQLGPSVYKGVLPNRTQVIAKLINDDLGFSEKEFRSMVCRLGGTHHRNLVSLKGFCFDQKHKVLIYEYVPNGSLEKWLFSGKNRRNWDQRLKIALGISQAIAYLHLECQQCIIHGNLKLENVLIDDKLEPKLTDFGLKSLVRKESVSSSSSPPPESPSEKDIRMLGNLLLQIAMCKKEFKSENLNDFLDELNQEQEDFSKNEDDLKAVERVARIAFWCLQNQPFLRPSIAEVVKVIEGTLSVDRPPPDFDLTRIEVEVDS